MSDIAEILLAQIWNSQWFRQPLRTCQGGSIRVVYPGVWTHGFGPDFTNAMLEIDGHLVTGDVEIDLTVAGWQQHGHHQNDAYNDVVLQVVGHESDEALVRRPDGISVARVALLDYLRGPLDEFREVPGLRPLGAIGFDSCAPGPSEERPDLVLDVCQRAGDRRMQERVSTISGELAVDPPAQILYSRLLDALGFSRNRAPMAEVAARISHAHLVSRLSSVGAHQRLQMAEAMLLGVAGFLPLSPRDAAVASLEPEDVRRIEQIWQEHGSPWRGYEVTPGFWTLSRSRPAAHPVRRLLAAAVILARAENGLVERLVELLWSDHPRAAINEWLVSGNPYLGKAHAHEIITNVIVPFSIAYGEEASQPDLVDAGAELWHGLPAGRGNTVTRWTMRQISGEAEIRPRTARAEQGLIHINRNGCSQMRCYECPIAHLALEWEGSAQQQPSGS